MALLGRVIVYARDVEATVAFYQRHFGLQVGRTAGDRIVELSDAGGGAVLMVHAAGKAQKLGQTVVKLVFDVADVAAFRTERAAQGLQFGAIHLADGYAFANAKDPDGNAISVSSRAFRDKP